MTSSGKSLKMSLSIQGRLRLSLILLATTSVSACTALPSSGPSSERIDSDAAIKVTHPAKTKGYQVGVDYALVDLTTSVLAHLDQARTPTLVGGFGSRRTGVPELPVGVGDVVGVAIFESQQGGLFIPSDAGSRPGNFVTIPNQTVNRDGNLTIPYAGQIRAAGRSANDIEREIERKLANRAIEPQVLITKVSSRSAQVAVVGNVNSPAKIEISEAGDRVLDVIAQAGGLSSPGKETYITLQRRGRTATVLYDYLIRSPEENIFVAPGDTVIVERDRRTFMAFGASGINGRFNFEDMNLTLSEALAQAGGLLDGRADPSQVLLYRVVDRELLRSLGVDVSRYISPSVPVIFRANLRDPSTFFLTQRFPMQDKDILYVTNAKSVELRKFLDIVDSASSTIANVPGDSIRAKNAIEKL